jgi:hypothetical protein
MPTTTLNDFFGISVTGSWDDIVGKLQNRDSLSDLKSRVVSQFAAEHWPNMVAGIGEKARELFDLDIGWLLVTGWSKYQELREYADPAKHPPGESNLVPLGKHTLNVSYSPYLEILYNGQPFGKLAFDVILSFELEGFVLAIEDGKIKKIHTGKCNAAGKIEYKDYTLAEKALTRISLPGTVDLGDGISLRQVDKT